MNQVAPLRRPDSLGRADRDRVVAEIAGEVVAAAKAENYAADRMALSVASRILRPNRPELADLLDTCAETILPGSNLALAEIMDARNAAECLANSAEYAAAEAERNLP